jgi:hypothetical protein
MRHILKVLEINLYIFTFNRFEYLCGELSERCGDWRLVSSC